MGTDGKPSGVRNAIVRPSLLALRSSDVSVRTTPLTCGCQASVAMSTRIKQPTACARPRATAPAICTKLVTVAGFPIVYRVACEDSHEFLFHLYDGSSDCERPCNGPCPNRALTHRRGCFPGRG